jgi:hypothetical protein
MQRSTEAQRIGTLLMQGESATHLLKLRLCSALELGKYTATPFRQTQQRVEQSHSLTLFVPLPALYISINHPYPREWSTGKLHS